MIIWADTDTISVYTVYNVYIYIICICIYIYIRVCDVWIYIYIHIDIGVLNVAHMATPKMLRPGMFRHLG